MRSARGKQKNERIRCFSQKFVLSAIDSVVFINCGYEFHKPCNSRVEREIVHISVHILNAVSLGVKEVLIVFIESKIAVKRLIAACFCYDSLRALDEFSQRLDSVIVPRTACGVVETEHKIHSENVRTVGVDIRIGRNHVSAGLAHSHSVRT